MRFARELTAIIAGPIAVWIVGWGHEYVFDAAIALIGILALHEFLSLGRAKGYDLPIVLSRKPLADSLPSSAIAVLATTYVGMLGGSLIRLRNDFPVGWKLVFFLLLVVWLGDSGAYYVGRAFGKHKLSPRISPKKTVEGLAGGIATSIITAVVIHFTFFKELALLHAVVAGTILSVA